MFCSAAAFFWLLLVLQTSATNGTGEFT